MRRSFARGLGVGVVEVTSNAPAARTGASGGSNTGMPATNIASYFDSASNGSPDETTRFAILPASSVPVRASTPSMRAGVVVSEASASSFVRPCVIASASRLRNAPRSCMRWVVRATFTPDAMNRLGLVGAWRQVRRSRSDTESAAVGDTRSGGCGKSIGRMSDALARVRSAVSSACVRNSLPPPRTDTAVAGMTSCISPRRRVASSSSDASSSMPCVPRAQGRRASSAFMSSNGIGARVRVDDSLRQLASSSVCRIRA